MGFLVIDFPFHCRYLIGQFLGLSLHLPVNSLFDGNMVLPEMVQSLEDSAVRLLVGRFTHLLELLTLGIELLLHGFNESDSLGFKHLFHLHPDASNLQLQFVDAGLELLKLLLRHIAAFALFLHLNVNLRVVGNHGVL